MLSHQRPLAPPPPDRPPPKLLPDEDPPELQPLELLELRLLDREPRLDETLVPSVLSRRALPAIGSLVSSAAASVAGIEPIEDSLASQVAPLR